MAQPVFTQQAQTTTSQRSTSEDIIKTGPRPTLQAASKCSKCAIGPSLLPAQQGPNTHPLDICHLPKYFPINTQPLPTFTGIQYKSLKLFIALIIIYIIRLLTQASEGRFSDNPRASLRALLVQVLRPNPRLDPNVCLSTKFKDPLGSYCFNRNNLAPSVGTTLNNLAFGLTPEVNKIIARINSG